MQYILMNPTTGSIELLDKDSYIVPLEQAQLDLINDDELWDAADDTSMTVIPVLETLEQEEELPDHTDLAAAGYPHEPDTFVTWKDLAVHLLAKQEPPKGLVLGEHAQWYTRAMAVRGQMQIVQDIEQGQAWLEGEGKDAAHTFRESVKGMIAYNEQLLREARQVLPEDLVYKS